VGCEKRQVIDLDSHRFVTEYQAEILENVQKQRIMSPFPAGVERAVQYGPELKAHAVHLSQYPLLPYGRVREYFEDQADVPLSTDSLFNVNHDAFNKTPDSSRGSRTVWPRRR
jgi:transposase